MRRARLLTPLLLVALALCAFAASAQADNSYPGVSYLSSFGSLGAGAGQFSSTIRGVAVNYTSGDVYVADAGNNRIDQFTAAGAFIRAWGKDVVASGPDDSGTGFEVCDTAAHPADVCKAGDPGFSAGAFNTPPGVAVDNSCALHSPPLSGAACTSFDPAAGDVYVQDAGNNRIERFGSDGSFVLMWGKGVDQTSGADVCTAISGDGCIAGASSSEAGGFNNLPIASSDIGVDQAGRVFVGDGLALSNPRLQEFDSSGGFLGQVAPPSQSFVNLFNTVIRPDTVFPDAAGNVYVADDLSRVQKFQSTDFSAAGFPAAAESSFDTKSQPGGATVDPANQYLFVSDSGHRSPCAVASDKDFHLIEYHPGGQVVDCSPPTTPQLADAGPWQGMAISADHRLYATVHVGALGVNAPQVRVFSVPVTAAPVLGAVHATDIVSGAAVIEADVTGNLADTNVHLQYGPEGPCSTSSCASTPDQDAGASRAPETQSFQLNNLTPDTTYHYRVIADNGVGPAVIGPDQKFHTFPAQVFDPSCPNNLARQQTGAAFLDDCRAYELVSAQDTGGYNVESNLIGGQTPYPGYPEAKDKALYAVHSGGIPNTGKPTNRGPDPYVATRDPQNQRWNTTYVGIPADVGSTTPFSSTLQGADAALSAFAFAGPEICDPCFPDNTTGVPLRLPDGSLIQGMAGSLPVSDPTPAATVKAPLSPDGSHFLFGSTQQFEPQGNSNNTDATIYSRDLSANTTEVISTDQSGATIQAGTAIAELGVSTDGSRTLFGTQTGTDAQGSPLYHLYLHLAGTPASIDLMPTATAGAHYAGMNAAATEIYFTTAEALSADTDTSVDLYRAEVDPSATFSLTRVSTGASSGNTDACDPAGDSYNSQNWNTAPGGPTDCSVLAVGGGGGVAEGDGSAYFLSPEQLDGGGGTSGAPNLYLARPGSPPRFVATLESSANQATPAPIHAFKSYFGHFDNGEGVAIDHKDASTYVYDPAATGAGVGAGPGAVVKKYDASGNLDASFGDHGVLDGSNSPGGSLGAKGSPTASSSGDPVGVPTQIAVDNSSSSSAGDLYVSDLLDASIKKFDSAGHYLSKIAGVSNSLSDATGVAVNPANGNLYVCTQSTVQARKVRIFDPSGGVVKAATTLTGASMALGLAVDSANHLYVATGASGVKTYDATSIALTGTLYSGTAYGVSVDPTDNHVYVDTGTSVIEFDQTGTQVGAAFGSDVLAPGSVSLAADSNNLVVSNPAGHDVASFGPRLVQPDPAYDNPLVIDSAKEPGTRHSADLQISANGRYGAFESSLPLDGSDYDAADHEEVFRFDADAADPPRCLSCTPTLNQPQGDASLPAEGLGALDDGRVFFNTAEALVMRDTNKALDAYQWEGNRAELISSGQSDSDSGMLSASADGTDAFFFTREPLTTGEQNGNLMKLYDARAGGGFFVVPPPPSCVASDECHGPGSQAPPQPGINTVSGPGGNLPTPPKPCRKGKVRRHGRCVTRHPHKHHKRQHKRAGAGQGGAK